MTSPTATKYDVFLSFRGVDTRRNFISFLYKEFVRRKIRTFKDDKELENGRRISPELKRAIEESKFAVVVVSVNYAASPWCLDELVKIMDFENKGSITVMPIFYGVDPCHLRRQIGDVAEQFKKHEAREEDHEKVASWRRALTSLASISGDCSSKCEDEAKLVDEIADKISKNLMTVTTISNGKNLVGIDTHMKALNKKLDLNSNKSLRVVGIWARGYNGRSALAKYVYQDICHHFDSHCFLGSVKRISQGRHLSHLHEEFLIRIQGSKHNLKDQKVLLVADDVYKLEQLDALAEDFNGFGPGSVVIITTQDKHLFVSAGIKLVYEVELLKFQKVCELFRQFAFKKRDISAAVKLVYYRATNWLGCLSGRSG
ncbi:Similar to NL27 [Arabidopsis thaliana]|jgi:hypothetical protein|uniref:At1g72940/F3N23_14 n=1 Tax=Arabidopsis thaliana TaxID=3702 RepID=Q9SSN2_ARATH|nr:Toll-Interleukin-Resistance (TIR) domain-containing protein [Arabidopsis thaliana]AAD55641.1 Similar to NL27 [Arabidopsis thaliana]AAL57646.1 At1g72940/F3N23_14 [Arabidopsis thaliana]AAN31114.1 At1g72940/F3N23_14 [Arabidopsis thaliana]AEE35394.1 Toll-Interleukin-Resistance (TIR) domain-containing protein [Arabidopsis thaliana]|eukprot:NP_177437.1 Toll-Interleukin-Resistance (TIR) domain-containing protein [Arabidopsis thaliana]